VLLASVCMGRDPGADRLSAYRAKRSAESTPEPFGGEGVAGGGRFVVQKHAARRLHYDLRLEHRGVLMSWAVPAGISFDPADKRFAAHTEDHPIEYADFEGVIPAGEYGAGQMIVWDRGAMRWAEDPDDGLTKGKLLFDLYGYKLNGQWTLVRMKTDAEWLLIKHADAWSVAGDRPEDPRSVLSGSTIEDLATGSTARHDAMSGIVVGAPVGGPSAGDLDVMLAGTRDTPFSDPEWIFEIKYDGYRMVVGKEGRTVTLRYRSGLDATAMFPEIASAVRRLPFDRLVIDGEVAVLDGEGKPSFSGLQKRGRLANRHQIAIAGVQSPATYFGFDLVTFDDRDLRPLPLESRKEALGHVIGSLGPLRFADHVTARGEAMFASIVDLGLEGVMAKKASSPYVGGRSDLWLKIRRDQIDEFAIVGYSSPKGTRRGIGALHLAYLRSGDLVYGGRVGSGMTESDRSDLAAGLAGTEIAEPPVPGSVPSATTDTWVSPTMACRVRYKELTADGALRQPVFVDHHPLDIDAVLRNDVSGTPEHEPPTPSIVDARSTQPTNPDKVFWPDEGYTKGDLIAYYEAVCDALIPYLADRPLVMDRFPDGIDGKSFFQKNAPDFVPEWIRTEWVGSDDETGNNYIVVEDLEALRYVANLASIPLHLWASRIDSLDAPDWCVLDLDPKDAPFTDVVTVARAIRDVCEAMGLPSYPKTSGKTGLHVLIPMGAAYGYDQQKLLGELIARVVESRHGDIATTVRLPAKRGGRVYIDYLQNGRGKLLVAPYSVRPVPGATVSAPLHWREVTPSLDIGRFTIRSMPRRLASMKADPMQSVLHDVPDILGGLRALARLVAAE
jgi:bifunctional non-homologous end joining protein LigD